MKVPKVLAIDDEPAILAVIKDSLSEKFDVVTKNSAADGIASTIDEKPDLILIDNIMPDMSGLEAVKTIRRASSANHIPIIMLTALKNSVDRIEAYRAGVDDFISKPFRPEELLARVESRIARFGTLKSQESGSHQIGNLTLNPDNHDIRIDGHPVHLTKIELTILERLITEKDNLVTRESLQQAVWTKPPADERLLDIHMATLRKKINAFDHRIETVYGKGYMIRSYKK